METNKKIRTHLKCILIPFPATCKSEIDGHSIEASFRCDAVNEKIRFFKKMMKKDSFFRAETKDTHRK